MATNHVLPVAVRSTFRFGHEGDANPTPVHQAASDPQMYRLDFPSTDWLDPGHGMSAAFEASYDDGASWSPFSGFTGATSGVPGKDGLPHAPTLFISWDGRAIDVRGEITITEPAFAWGLDITTV